MQQPPSKSILKEVKSLGDIKGRRQSGCFKAEGTKCVIDTLGYFDLVGLYATAAWAGEHPEIEDVTICSRADMERMSSLSTAPAVIAVYRIPERSFDPKSSISNLVLALDTIQDPGNLGTIVRIADWFGIRDIVCSRESVDLYNPKTVQSTMGSISRVSVTYHDNLPGLLKLMNKHDVPIFGTFLGGENIFEASLPSHGVIVIGNEGQGISWPVAETVTRRLTIPSFPGDCPTGESLNAAVATAITVAQFRSKTYGKKG